jgi:hypothetical protein
MDIENIKTQFLPEFIKNNPQCRFSTEEDMLILDQPWGFEANRLIFSLTNDVVIIKDLNNVYFRPQFDAIMHIDKNVIEFLYGYVLPLQEPSKSTVNRKFTAYFNKNKYECYFGEPTNRVFNLARSIKWLFTEDVSSIVSQLRVFRDAQRVDDLPAFAKIFLKRESRSVFLLNPVVRLIK